jgi:hypothetical protein
MKTNPEINALKHTIKDLEDTIAHYKARDDMITNMLNRITDIADELEEAI